MQRRRKAGWAAGVAAAAATVLAAGLTTPIAAAQEGPAASAGAPQAKHEQRGGTARTWVTLITGDRVSINPDGRGVSLRPAEGRKHVPLRVERYGGHVYAIPSDARRLINRGTLDRRLFDVTELSRPQYVAQQREGLRLIVAYRGERAAARNQLRGADGVRLRRTLPVLGADAVTASPTQPGAVWETLTNGARGAEHRTAAAGVARVWLDGVRRATLDTSVPQIGAPTAWQAGYDGKGTKIAVLDSGVDETHADLAGQQVAEKNFSEAADAKDRVGHGTHVASTAAGTGAKSGGKYRGVAPGARLIDGKVLDDGGSGWDSDIVAGAEWAVAEKADVINLSLGGLDTPDLDPLETAINKLSAEHGTLFAVSAGNEGAGAGTVGSPGSADAALTVGAVDKKDALADFSSRGPRVGDGAVKPDVTAPGVDIGAAAAPGSQVAKDGTPVADGYVAISGTSMAAPHVAGAAALLAQQHPTWTGAELKAVLTGSAVPGPYTPFEQGAGRIDLRKALTQTVVAEPVSLSFGTQQWPHADDAPQRKELTYRNLGDQPVTLKLAVAGTGPAGKPAPAGFFTAADQQLTVPAHATATTSLSVDTRIGGDADGAYTAVVAAPAGKQVVRTAAAVVREVESYEVTLTHLGRDGKPSGSFETDLFGLAGLGKGTGFRVDETSKETTVRVPKGSYLLDSLLRASEDSFDWLVQPKLVVDKDTKVTLDARVARQVEVTVPDRKAVAGAATVDYDVADFGGVGLSLDSFKPLRIAHLGPDLPAGELSQWFSAGFQGSAADTLYFVGYGGPTTRLATGFVRHAKSKELGKITAELGGSVPGQNGTFGVLPERGGLGIYTPDTPLPHPATLYANGNGMQWSLHFSQSENEETNGVYYYSDPIGLKPGVSSSRQFNVGVFGPKVAEWDGIFRQGNTLSGSLSLFADGANHSGNSEYDAAKTTLYRNGKLVGTNTDPLTGAESFRVPAEEAKYKLSTSVTRSKVANVSTKIEAAWTFSSKQTDSEVALPTSAVRFTPALAVDSTSKAGATVTVPVSVQGSAAGKNLKSLAVYVSYDDGKKWKKLPVRAGKVSVKNPGPGKAVSFKAEAADKQGNTVSQTIHSAYRTR
ncbi:S8 family serine peptidase [Streptomyces sp. HSW2009]|uniref:S8 family peptidase n=1 Tax=Streptomyces sp. HSW2009 TaxID=3142890 RepID=UPI0032EDB947